MAASAGGLGLWARDLNGDDVWVNSVLRAQLGISPNQPVRAGDLLASMHPDDRGRVLAEVQRAQDAINNGVLTGDTTFLITSDLTDESGEIALNQWIEEGPGGYTLTFKPSGAARVISGSVPVGVLMLNGADRVTFEHLDGDPVLQSPVLLRLLRPRLWVEPRTNHSRIPPGGRPHSLARPVADARLFHPTRLDTGFGPRRHQSLNSACSDARPGHGCDPHAHFARQFAANDA